MISSLPTFQNLKAEYRKFTLHFKNPGGTSRGVLHERASWFLMLYEKDRPQITGIGECAPLKGLSIDDRPDFEDKIKQICDHINDKQTGSQDALADFPSLQFGLETALLDLANKGKRKLFRSSFTDGQDKIRINGLIWMGEPEFMKEQIDQKIRDHFHCIKIKIGALDFKKELELLQYIREQFPAEKIELRVDANGAFALNDAEKKLAQLAALKIHSIEQPIRQGQWKALAGLCKNTPIPVALDEELIGIHTSEQKKHLLETIRPQYLILKPSLLGGFKHCEEWIRLAEQNNTGWWITSALESNIGLNAIAQWTYTLKNPMPQGLGTGQLFTNNFSSPLYLQGEWLGFDDQSNWDLSAIHVH